MNQVSFDRPQNIDLHHLAPNHGFCVTACKVVAAVVAAIANLFRTIGLSFVIKAAIWLKREAALAWIVFDKLNTPEMTFYESRCMLLSVACIPSPEREAFVRNALLLITPEMPFRERIRILQSVARIPAPEREAVIRNALSLITPQMDFYDRISMLQSVARIPAPEREAVIRNALSLITPQMDFYDRIPMLVSVAHIPANQRDDVITYALQLITPHMPVRYVDVIILDLVDIRADQRVNYVQQHIHWQEADWEAMWLLLLQDGQQGIDVHAGDRDLRLRDGIQLLRAHQGNIPGDRINLAVKEFQQYLNDCQMDDEHKRLAQHALSAPKGQNESFGPLISATEFSVLGLQISGQELVARLWIFASKLTEPDQTSAKTSMISALKDSYESDGSRSCNQGKTQRLIVGVLQGRFEGVNIELKPDMELPIPKAIEMFFNITAHREIEQLQPLLDAANRFCDENPLVNRALFVEEMGKYAKQQHMEVPIPQAQEMFFNIPAHQEIKQLQPLLDAANRFCDENPLVNRALFVEEMGKYAKQQFLNLNF